MKNVQRFATASITLLGIFLTLSACDAEMETDDDGLDLQEGSVEFRGDLPPLNHPSGVCRVEGQSGVLNKVVKYYHESNPDALLIKVGCDPWMGTSECCAEKNYWGLTEEQCKQLRHQPDCPKYGGPEPWQPPTQVK